jgi:hypothetical protein
MGPVGLIVLIIVLLLVFGGLPQVSGSWHNYGYAPTSLGVVLLVVLIVLLLTGRL